LLLSLDSRRLLDGDAVSRRLDLVEDLTWASERPLGVDHPPGVVDRRRNAPERRGFVPVALRREDVQLAGVERVLQVAQEPAP